MAWGFWEKYIENPVKELGRDIDDEILQPVKNTVEAIVENPRALAGLALAIAFPGAGSALGAQLGLFGTVGQVVGQTILNTVINGGDVKQAVISAALPVAGAEVTGQVSKLLTAADISGTLNTVISNAVTQGATAAALNQDIEKAILGSLIQSTPAIIGQYIPEFKDLPRAAQEAAVAATADLIVTGGDNLGKIATMGVASGLTDYALKNIDGYKDLRPAQRDIVRSRISNVLQGNDLSAELLNGAMSWGMESVQNYNRQENAARKLYKAQTNRELPESFLAEYSGDIDNLVDEVDNLVVSDSEKTQLAKDLFGSDIDLGILYNAPDDFTQDQFTDWLQDAYEKTQSAATGEDFNQEQKDVLTEYVMAAPEYLDTVQKSMRYLDAVVPDEQLDAYLKKAGGWSGAMNFLGVFDTPEAAAEYVARDYLFDRDSKQFTQSELSTQIPLKDGQATSMYGLVRMYGADEARRMFEAHKSGEQIELPVEVPGMKELQDILAGTGSGTQYAGAGSGTATDAGANGNAAPFADVKQGIAGYLSGSVGENTGISRNDDGTYSVADPSNYRSLRFSSDGTYMGSIPSYEIGGPESTTSKIAQDFIDGFTNSPYAKSFTGTATVDGSDAGASTGATTGGTSTDGDFWKSIGIDPGTFTDSSPSLSNDEIMALIGYGEAATPPVDGSGRPLYGDVSGSFGGGPLTGFTLASEANGAKVYENDGFTLLALANGSNALLDKTDPTPEPIWLDPVQLESILRPAPVEPTPPVPEEITPTEPPKETTLDDLIKELTPTTPAEPAPPTSVEPTPPTPPAPVEPAPVTPEPVEPTPVTPSPAEPTPVTPTPVEPTPVTPVEPAPVTPTPTEPVTPPVTPPVEPAPPTGITPSEVQKIVDDALKANPNLTASDVQKIVSDAVSVIPNLTADQVKQIVGDELAKVPTAATPTDVQNAVDAAKTETAGQIADAESRLTDAIAAAEAMGLSRDQAITAAVDSVAAEIGITRADLLAQLGTTEAALRTEFATGISGLEAQTKAQYDSLNAAQKSTADALVAQGQSMQQAITAAQQQTTGQIADVETRLTDAIAAAEAMGLSRDQAITAAVESVAADLGTTKTDILTKLGTTEQALRTEFTTGLAGVSAEVKTAYDSLSAEQKALADQLAQQGIDLTTAIQTAQTQTSGQIGELTTDVQAKYDALNAAQKAEADARVAQGQNLQDAITGVAGQVTGLEGQLTAQGKDFADQLVRQGMDYTTAMQTAISAQSALFGTQLGGVQAEIAANEARRIADQQAAAAAAEAQRQADQRAAAERARQESVRGGIRTTGLQGQQQLQALQQQLPQAMQMAQTTTTPIYGEMGPYLDLGSPLDFDFFKPSAEKQAGAKQAQPTKIAAGGYIDDLLAEGMTVDDLLNLLR
jgi:hypothetical protein